MEKWKQRVLTSSIRTSESQLTAKQPFIKRHWNVPKWYSTAKEKSTTRWEEWHTHNKKSNSITAMEDSQSGKQLYHKISPTGVKVLRPTLASQHEDLATGRDDPNIWLLKASNVCLQELHQTGGKRLCSWSGTQGPMYTKTRKWSSGPIRDWVRHTGWYWRVFHGVVGLGNTVGAKTLAATIIRGTHWWRYSKGCN